MLSTYGNPIFDSHRDKPVSFELRNGLFLDDTTLVRNVQSYPNNNAC